MLDRQAAIFPELTPPPGGLDRLRNRLDGEGKRRSGRWYPALACATLVLACLLLWMGGYWSGRWGGGRDSLRDLALARNDGNPVLVKFGLVEGPADPVTLSADQRRRAALQRVPVEDPRVIYYRFSVVDLPGSAAD